MVVIISLGGKYFGIVVQKMIMVDNLMNNIFLDDDFVGHTNELHFNIMCNIIATVPCVSLLLKSIRYCYIHI